MLQERFGVSFWVFGLKTDTLIRGTSPFDRAVWVPFWFREGGCMPWS